MKRIGKWAFVLGVLVSIVSGFINSSVMVTILIILGLVVGFLNISEKEAEKFLISAVALLMVGTASFSVIMLNGSFVSGTLQQAMNNFVSFVAAAAIVVAIKTVLNLGEHPDNK
jgi:hypothetical protein